MSLPSLDTALPRREASTPDPAVAFVTPDGRKTGGHTVLQPLEPVQVTLPPFSELSMYNVRPCELTSALPKLPTLLADITTPDEAAGAVVVPVDALELEPHDAASNASAEAAANGATTRSVLADPFVGFMIFLTYRRAKRIGPDPMPRWIDPACMIFYPAAAWTDTLINRSRHASARPSSIAAAANGKPSAMEPAAPPTTSPAAALSSTISR
jgi:hypothetical protein